MACSLYSTAALEAMVMQKPLVVFNIHPLIPKTAWWPKRGGGIYVKCAKEMMEFSKKSVSDKGFLSELVREQNGFLCKTFANHGRAAEAVLEEIQTLVKYHSYKG